MAAGFLDIRDERVQEFLWEHLVPSDIRWDYTKADAFRYVFDQVMCGAQWLAGDLEREVVFRILVRNPKVIEPHVMGKGNYLRSVFAECLPLAWERGVEKVMIWTQHPSIGCIFTRLGFTKEGNFTRMHYANGQLQDLAVYSLERPSL